MGHSFIFKSHSNAIVIHRVKIIHPGISVHLLPCQFKSGTTDLRSSENAWVGRHAHPVIDSIHRRIADILGINEYKLHPNFNAEAFQVVHYRVGGEYKYH